MTIVEHCSWVQADPNFTLVLQGRPHEGRLLIHGGAWDIPLSLRAAHRQGLSQARQRVLATAQQGASHPLELVVEGLAALEDDPTFDAGFGSFLNELGQVELDAGIMEGQALQAGAVAALGAFRNPAQVALAVLQHSEHVLLVGEGASAFAQSRGFESVAPRSLVHPREQVAFEAWLAAGKPSAKTFFGQNLDSQAGSQPDKRGTVGLVLALRPQGGQEPWSLFAGTSTGGTPGKMWGRVGDVAIPGAGFYADDEGACVSSTGWGEAFLRTLACKSVSDLCAQGIHPQQACRQVLQHMLRRTGGRGGLIAISKEGQVGAAYSTPDMAVLSPVCQQLA